MDRTEHEAAARGSPVQEAIIGVFLSASALVAAIMTLRTVLKARNVVDVTPQPRR